MRAISVLSLETGTSTRWCLAAAALRRRVKKSAMGSVCMILLPAGFHHARDFPAQRHAAKTDAAHLKLANIAARSAADAAAVAHADLEFRLLAGLEVRNGLFGPRYDGLLPGDLPELLRGGVQQLHVLAGFAEPDVYRDLLELGNRHAVLPAKALHQRRDRLSPVFFLQSAFHRPLRLVVYLYLSSVALQCRQLRIFEPSGKIVWPTRVCLPQLGQTIITLEALMLPSFSMIPPFTFFEGLGRVWRLMIPTCSTTTVFFWPLTQR